MRAGAYSWRSSAKAIERLKSTRTEVRSVARKDVVKAAEGVIALVQRIWPAFEHIDTSSGALGSAVNRTLEDLLPILIEVPADDNTRAKWLEQLRTAILDDGVDLLAPIADRFREIAAFSTSARPRAAVTSVPSGSAMAAVMPGPPWRWRAPSSVIPTRSESEVASPADAGASASKIAAAIANDRAPLIAPGPHATEQRAG